MKFHINVDVVTNLCCDVQATTKEKAIEYLYRKARSIGALPNVIEHGFVVYRINEVINLNSQPHGHDEKGAESKERKVVNMH